jgi:uncharacterized surface protein with fasciclin (FAS1) repeats
MLLDRTPNLVAVITLLAGLAQPLGAWAQSTPAERAKTQAAAAKATGKAASDSPSATRSQGAAWAVKEAAQGASANAPSAPAPAVRVAPHGDIVESLRASGQFTTFLKAAEAANLTGVLKANQNLTVFAPTDAAFAALPPGELEQLMGDRPQLQRLLTHHMVNARVASSAFRSAKGPAPSVAGDSIELDGTGSVLKADDAEIVQADVAATNGLIQVVDRVLTPRTAAQAAASQSAQRAEHPNDMPQAPSKK